MIRGLCPSRGCVNIQNLYKKKWEYSASAKIAACIPVIGVLVGGIAYASLKKKAAALDINKHVDRDQIATPSQKNAPIQSVLNNYLRAGLVNTLLSVAIVTYAVAMQIIPPVLGGVLIAGFAIAFVMLASRLCGDRVKKRMMPHKELEQAREEYNALCDEQTIDLKEFAEVLIKAQEDYKRLQEDKAFLKYMPQCYEKDEVALEQHKKNRQYTDALIEKLGTYPVLPEDSSSYEVRMVREIMTARMNHHAEMQVVMKTLSDEARADFNKYNEFIKQVQKSAVPEGNKSPTS